MVEQREAVGHAVRAAYMYAGMVDVATLAATTRPTAKPSRRIWEDVVSRKLYLTGALGARHDGEAFGDAFELPNRTAYSETCASIASVYWNQRMFLQSRATRATSTCSSARSTTASSRASRSAGDTFFYPNPLESDGRYAFNQGALTRKPWFDCSCCPTNLARFIPSVPDYVYAVRGDALYVNLFVASEASVDVGGASVTLTQKTTYPWDGRVELRIDPGRRAVRGAGAHPRLGAGPPVPSELYRYVRRCDRGLHDPRQRQAHGRAPGRRLRRRSRARGRRTT